MPRPGCKCLYCGHCRKHHRDACSIAGCRCVTFI